MSIGSFGGILGGAAGAPLSQTQGSESERAQKQAAAAERQAAAENHSDKASGIGETEENQPLGERDADGRRLFEDPYDEPQMTEEADSSPHRQPRKSYDATGEAGNQLDLWG